VNASAKQVADLLFRLRSARSPLSKVKVLQQAWQLLHGLTPSERRQVATELGFDGADSIVDRLAAERGGIAPQLIHELLDKAEGTDPEQVRALAAEMRDPQRRKNLLDRGLGAVETFVVTGSWPGQATASPVPPADTLATQPVDSAPPPPPPGAGPPRPPATTAATAAGAPPPPSPVAPPAAARSERPGPPRMTSQRPDPVPEREPLPPAPRPAEARLSWSPPSARPAGEVAPHAGILSDHGHAGWIARLRAAPSVLVRLRLLHENVPGLADENVDTLRQVLEAFPEPWAGRRAMLALLGSGIPAPVADAIALIDELQAAHDRRWCLTVLAGSRELSPADLEKVITRLGPGVPGRLLAARLRSTAGRPDDREATSATPHPQGASPRASR
jgi:hypothetical protein